MSVSYFELLSSNSYFCCFTYPVYYLIHRSAYSYAKSLAILIKKITSVASFFNTSIIRINDIRYTMVTDFLSVSQTHSFSWLEKTRVQQLHLLRRWPPHCCICRSLLVSNTKRGARATNSPEMSMVVAA